MMGSIMGKVTDAVGLTDNKGAKAAQRSADRNADRSYAMTQEELEFQRDQYNEWKDIYGPLQEELGDYFKNLTGQTLAAKQIEQLQAGSQEAQQRIDQELAQRGMGGSGLEAAALTQNLFGTEMAKAGVRASADEMANQQKMGFLGLGLGQGQGMLQTQAGLTSSGAANLVNLSGQARSQATTIGESNRGFMRDLAGSSVGFATGKGWM